MIQVVITEDDKEISEALNDFLNSREDMECCASFGAVEPLIEYIENGNIPDIILMDIGLPGLSGIDGIKIVKEKKPEIDIIMLTIYEDAHKIFQSLCAGASGYLLKNSPFSELAKSIVCVYEGGAIMSPEIARKVVDHFQDDKIKKTTSPLTKKEKKIVEALVDGLSYKMIADRLSISVETVRTHIKNIYKKLHVHSKAEVIRKSLDGEI